MFKKSVVRILGLFLFISYSYGAVFSISPEEWKVAPNCMQEVKVVLNMDEWDEAITADLVLSSNMEFVEFKNGDVFKYSVPPTVDGNLVKLMLFNEPWWEVTKWWVVWMLYYKTKDVSNPYVDIQFLWVWETVDTNLNIKGRDILTRVRSGKYVLSDDVECENPVVEILKDSDDMEKFIQDFQADHRWENLLLFLKKNKRYILWILLLVALILLVSHKSQKKW